MMRVGSTSVNRGNGESGASASFYATMIPGACWSTIDWLRRRPRRNPTQCCTFTVHRHTPHGGTSMSTSSILSVWLTIGIPLSPRMNSETYDVIFARANEGRRNFIEVSMDHADIVLLPENQGGANATRRLAGCSGVVVLGRTAAIMAHIAPLPPRPARNSPTPSRPGTANQGTL